LTRCLSARCVRGLDWSTHTQTHTQTHRRTHIHTPPGLRRPGVEVNGPYALRLMVVLNGPPTTVLFSAVCVSRLASPRPNDLEHGMDNQWAVTLGRSRSLLVEFLSSKVIVYNVIFFWEIHCYLSRAAEHRCSGKKSDKWEKTSDF